MCICKFIIATRYIIYYLLNNSEPFSQWSFRFYNCWTTLRPVMLLSCHAHVRLKFTIYRQGDSLWDVENATGEDERVEN